jgi:hypothetical protein
VNGELAPRERNARMSDADREQLVEHLQQAVGEGRLTLDEFQERVDGVLACRTFGEGEKYFADLPDLLPPRASAPRDVAEIRSTAAPLRRAGRWNVPRRLLVRCRAGSVKLDFTSAVIGCRVVEIVLDVVAGSTILVLPEGASVDVDNVEMMAGSLRVTLPDTGSDQIGKPHFVVTGTQKAGGLTVRRQHRFWRWRW